ncbi:MAG: hypothetical protein ACRECE_06145, partial [Xanthobacteraceae bacterium]
SDLKRLWLTLLPGMPFPQCGVPPEGAAADGETLRSANLRRKLEPAPKSEPAPKVETAPKSTRER